MSAHQEFLMVKKHKRRCVERPKSVPLTEQSLLELEQSQPTYRQLGRLLDHWFFYLQDTTADFFCTFIGSPDGDFYPPCFEKRGSVFSLSQADFQESHVSPPSSVDLFGLTARSPPPEVQVVIQVPRTPSEISWETTSPLHFTSTAIPSTVPETVLSTAVTSTVRSSLKLTSTGTSTPEANPRLRQRLSPVRIFVEGKAYTGPGIPHWTVDPPEPLLATPPFLPVVPSPTDTKTPSEPIDHLDNYPVTRLSPITVSSDSEWSGFSQVTHLSHISISSDSEGPEPSPVT